MELNFKQLGSGQPLIILHGFLGSLDNWQTLAARWAQQYQVFILDQRNHGKSPHSDEHSLALMTRDLFDFIHQNHLKKVSLIGHSMGGKVAMQFTLQHPELVHKLVVVDIAPRQYKHGHDEIFKALFSVKLDLVQTRKDAELMMEPYTQDLGIRQFLLKNLERKETGGFQWKMNLNVLHKHYAEIIKEVIGPNTYDGPVLVIKGANSNYIKPQDQPDFIHLFPNYKMVEIPQAGHWVHAEQPELVYQNIYQFLSI